MNNKAASMLTVLFLVIAMVMPLADPLTKLMPFSVYAKSYSSSAQLQNECSSEDGITNCANNNAETIGDENAVNPQVRQTSIESGEGGSPGEQGPSGATGATGPQGPAGQIDQPVLGANLVFGRTDFVIPPNEAAGATADCPPDTVVISGAYHGSGAPGIFVYGNKFTGGDGDVGIPPTGWFVGAFNTGPEFQGFTVWSICSPIVE